jgi:anti-sigma-K factor RskA
MEAGIHELTAGYALDALDPDERREFEAHLDECDRCREDLASFWTVTEALAVGASGRAPSGDLRGRILAAARAEPQVVVPFERRRRRVLPALSTAVAVAAIALVAVGFWALRLASDLDDTRSALERQREAAAVLADPSARTVAFEAGTGRLVVTDDGRAALLVSGLDRAPSGKTYEMWVIEGGTPAPAGLFAGDERAVPVEGTVDTGDVVAVTIEDEGGATTPNLPPIAASKPA